MSSLHRRTPRRQRTRLVDAARGVEEGPASVDVGGGEEPPAVVRVDESILSAAISIVSTSVPDTSNDVTMAAIKMARCV